MSNENIVYKKFLGFPNKFCVLYDLISLPLDISNIFNFFRMKTKLKYLTDINIK